MIKGENKRITMTKGDFGIVLPITINGAAFESSDEIKFNINNNCKNILEKTYTNITNNKIDFSLTEEESNLLEQDIYSFSIDWYRNGKFLCNIINHGDFVVESKC